MKTKNGMFIGVTLLLVVLLMLPLGCLKVPEPFQIPSVPPSIEAMTYSNSEYGFSLDYPADWDVEERWGKIVVTFRGPIVLESTYYTFYVNTGVAVEQLPEDMTLDNYVMATLDAQTSVSTFNISSGTISGVPAETIVFSSTLELGEDKIPLKDIIAVMIKDNIGYLIFYDVPAEFHDEYLDAFKLAVSTFKFEVAQAN